jgi:hypothetical protein
LERLKEKFLLWRLGGQLDPAQHQGAGCGTLCRLGGCR